VASPGEAAEQNPHEKGDQQGQPLAGDDRTDEGQDVHAGIVIA